MDADTLKYLREHRVRRLPRTRRYVNEHPDPVQVDVSNRCCFQNLIGLSKAIVVC